MKRPTALAGIAGLMFLMAACGGDTGPKPVRASESLTERGRYLVEDVGKCLDCHTPMTPQGPDMTKHLMGAKLGFEPLGPVPGWMPMAPRIAGIPNGWTEEHMVEFLRTGSKPGGAPAQPPMPAYRFHEDDARAVTAYLASLKGS